MRHILCIFGIFALLSPSFAMAQQRVSQEKPKVSQAAIEKRIVAMFKDQQWFEGAAFPWESNFAKIGKKPDAKTVLALSKKAFRFQCSESELSGVTTPRQLADKLLEMLNNGVYFYEKPNFEGPIFTLYAPVGKVTDLAMDGKYLQGSCIKPAGYEAKIEFGTNIFVKFGTTSTQWDAPNVSQKIPAEVLGRKSVKVRLLRE